MLPASIETTLEDMKLNQLEESLREEIKALRERVAHLEKQLEEVRLRVIG